MSVWFREIAGWIFLGLGVAAYALLFVLLTNRWFLEGGILAFAGFMLLRTGTHLLKVATAARAAFGIKKAAAQAKKPRVLTPGANQAVAGRPRPSVLPGPKRV
jgi:hypothetical protein